MEISVVCLVVGVEDVCGIGQSILGSISVGAQVHEFEILVSSVEVTVLSIFVSTNENTMKDILVQVSVVSFIVGIENVCGISKSILSGIGVRGKIHKLEVLISGVEVSIFGIFVSSNENTVEDILMQVGVMGLVMSVKDIGGICKGILCGVCVSSEIDKHLFLNKL